VFVCLHHPATLERFKMTATFDIRSNYVQIINGQSSPTEATRHGLNPATLEALPDVPVATPEDLDKAADAAKAAFKIWSATPFEDRKKAVLAYADAIEAYRDEFRDLLITEQGKPVFLSYLTRNILHIANSISIRSSRQPSRLIMLSYG
jgi:acyl-CoA reductase-like NAD-dependent aldehyde dehydrogenase